MFALADIEVDSRAIRGYLEGDDDEERRGRASRRVMHTAPGSTRARRVFASFARTASGSTQSSRQDVRQPERRRSRIRAPTVPRSCRYRGQTPTLVKGGARAGIASGIDSWRALRTTAVARARPARTRRFRSRSRSRPATGRSLTPGRVQLALLSHTNYTYGDDRHANDVESLIHKVNAEALTSGPSALAPSCLRILCFARRGLSVASPDRFLLRPSRPGRPVS